MKITSNCILSLTNRLMAGEFFNSHFVINRIEWIRRAAIFTLCPDARTRFPPQPLGLKYLVRQVHFVIGTARIAGVFEA